MKQAFLANSLWRPGKLLVFRGGASGLAKLKKLLCMPGARHFFV
jgi:hypothetical protein